jgi:hypothetical protein
VNQQGSLNDGRSLHRHGLAVVILVAYRRTQLRSGIKRRHSGLSVNENASRSAATSTAATRAVRRRCPAAPTGRGGSTTGTSAASRRSSRATNAARSTGNSAERAIGTIRTRRRRNVIATAAGTSVCRENCLRTEFYCDWLDKNTAAGTTSAGTRSNPTGLPTATGCVHARIAGRHTDGNTRRGYQMNRATAAATYASGIGWESRTTGATSRSTA